MMTAPERGAKMFQRGAAPRLPQFGPDIFTSSHQQWDSKIAAKSVLSKESIADNRQPHPVYGSKRGRSRGQLRKTPVTVTGLKLT